MDIEKVDIAYSLRNIPVPENNTHLRMLISKTEQFLQRIRWKVFFFFKERGKEKPNTTETYGFRTARNAPQQKELTNFENDVAHLISNLEYRDVNTPFQNKIRGDMRKINRSNKLFVAADKTSNVYKVGKDTYRKLMTDAVTNHYRKADSELEREINQEAKEITDVIGISDRVEPIAHKEAYVTIKDHKDRFPNDVKTRLINPAKSNIGRISKMILQSVNEQLRNHHGLLQWRSTEDALSWFNALDGKGGLTFLQLDIVDFYPSISRELFDQAIEFARETVEICDETKKILLNARQSLLFHDNCVWRKQSGLFDVTMGAYDGCEMCELVGLLILHKVKHTFPQITFGLYRDDGLGVHKNMPGPQLERLKKDITASFKNFGLKITIETNLTVVNFLDVTLNLRSGQFMPYRKPNDTPLYISTQSNHPQCVIKQVPLSVNKRLSSISSSKEIFDSAKVTYSKSLKESGHRHKLEYQPPTEQDENLQRKRKRKRKVTWYNPPYSAGLKTNLGNQFLKLVDKNFPKNNALHAILNRRTIKVSYSCTDSIGKIMHRHNRKIMRETGVPETTKTCNCRNKAQCPVDNKCCTQGVIYKATLTHNNAKAEYIGSTELAFKTRYNLHTHSFRHESKRAATTLSQYVWSNNLNPDPAIKWEILKKCLPYEQGRGDCDICLSEKVFIIRNLGNPDCLNKRTDIANRCPHKKKYKLDQWAGK